MGNRFDRTVNRAAIIAFLVILSLIVAFFIHVELVDRPEYERFMTTPNTLRPGEAGRDDPRYQHCVELRRLQALWFDYPYADMWERLQKRYDRECPDHGSEIRPDIEWSPDLPPEPPE